jgi:hypothetical protein
MYTDPQPVIELIYLKENMYLLIDYNLYISGFVLR